MHALIIEHVHIFALAVEDELRELGYTSIEVVDTDDDAIQSAARRCPDLITADQRLASGSGVNAIRAICGDRHIPFVFITSYRDEVREAFPEAVLVGKPFMPPTLREAIGTAIEQAQSGAPSAGGAAPI
jgi:CheY-like chemotaxis protein